MHKFYVRFNSLKMYRMIDFGFAKINELNSILE